VCSSISAAQGAKVLSKLRIEESKKVLDIEGGSAHFLDREDHFLEGNADRCLSVFSFCAVGLSARRIARVKNMRSLVI
jgi:hypothetical protein